MSFAAQVKEELVESPLAHACCRTARAYGLMLFGRSFSSKSVSFQTENESTAQLYREEMKALCGVRPSVRRNGNSGKITLTVEEVTDRLKVLAFFGHSAGEVTLRINRANLNCDACAGAFLQGAFLSCGTVSAPDKDYHLEWVIPFLNLSRHLEKLLMELDFNVKSTTRKGYHVVYFKDSESIEDMLTFMGASNCALEIMGVKVYKDFRNKANRMTNCETANIARMVQAAGPQLDAIRKIQMRKGLHSLPEELQELAQLRLDNPEASLQELSEMLSTPLSRSGINHRLKRIQQFAQELK